MTTKPPKTTVDAALLLDGHDPTWYTKIDLDKLDMEDSELCILGQLSGSYDNHPIYKDYYEIGGPFSTYGSKSEWISEINKRRENAGKTSTYECGGVKFAATEAEMSTFVDVLNRMNAVPYALNGGIRKVYKLEEVTVTKTVKISVT